jgi:hypothetical protein
VLNRDNGPAFLTTTYFELLFLFPKPPKKYTLTRVWPARAGRFPASAAEGAAKALEPDYLYKYWLKQALSITLEART